VHGIVSGGLIRTGEWQALKGRVNVYKSGFMYTLRAWQKRKT
jgi:hypothetical protein